MSRATPFLLALALAGCAQAPMAPPHARAPMAATSLPPLQPGAGVVAEPELPIERWWTLFDDPVLAARIEQALRDNHDLAAAAARVQEARARLDEVRGSRLPTVDVEASHARNRQPADGRLPPGTPLTASQHQVGLVARHELDLWGRIASGRDAAQARLQAQQWVQVSVAWGLSAQIAEAHYGLRAVQRQIELAGAVRDTRATSLALRRREQAAGIANEFDLRRAEAESAASELTLAQLQRQRVGYEAALALLLGRVVPDAAEPQPLDPAAPLALRLPQGGAAERLLQRPDVRRAEAELAAAQADIAAARAATLPRLSLSGRVGSDVRSMSDLFSAQGFVWQLAGSLTQNLFDAGQARARVNQADARADAAHAAYRQVVLRAVTELREAYAALDSTQRAEAAATARVRAMERAAQLARLGHASGALGYLDLLDAERNRQQAQLDEVNARRDRLLVQVAALKALGGGQAGQRPL